MDMEAERNVCPDCGELVPVGERMCPHCGRIFLPQHRTWAGYYALAWRHCFTFSGRAPLAELLSHAIPYALLLLWGGCYCFRGLKINPFSSRFPEFLAENLSEHSLFGLLICYLLIDLLPLPALISRRLHDIDIGLWDLDDEGAVSEGDFRDESPGWWVLWRYSLLTGGPFGWLLTAFPKLRHALIACLSLPFRVWEDSLPGPNRFGPGTRYPRFLDKR